MAEGSPREARRPVCHQEVVELRFLPGQAPAMAARTDGTAQGGSVGRPPPALYRRLRRHGRTRNFGRLAPVSTLARRAGLEDVFLTLTGRQLTELPPSHDRPRLPEAPELLLAAVPPHLERRYKHGRSSRRCSFSPLSAPAWGTGGARPAAGQFGGENYVSFVAPALLGGHRHAGGDNARQLRSMGVLQLLERGIPQHAGLAHLRGPGWLRRPAQLTWIVRRNCSLRRSTSR